MNSWLLLRRLRGPAFLILVGITALLNQWGVLNFGRSWPLYLILAGVFGLAERAAIAAAPPAVPPIYPAAYAPSAYSGYSPAPQYTGPTPEATPGRPAAGSGFTGDDPLADPSRRP
jgi:hypothetical protein